MCSKVQAHPMNACFIHQMFQKSIFILIFSEGKKMPPALRLGANPPFQRVEETMGACKKARLFTIVMAFLLHRSK
jgi:hypothetical protein